MTAPALLLVVKVSVVLVAALIAAWVMRHAPARWHHRLWSGVFAAVLLLPLMAAAAPTLRVPLPSWTATEHRPVDAIVMEQAFQSEGQELAPTAPSQALAFAPEAVTSQAAREPLSLLRMIAGVWVIGALAGLGMLAIALLRVTRLSRTSTVFSNADWHAQAALCAERLGLRAPVTLLVSPRVTTPMAGGVLRPVIFLPESAAEWTAERRDVVLAHEIAHLAGRDGVRQVITRLAVSLYWFHPLAWLAARESNAARERACDEAVIALGTRPSAYARVLLDFADGLPPSRISSAPLAVLPIVQRTLLERRLMAILNDTTRPATRRAALVFAALAALTLSVAAAQPVQIESPVQTASRVEGAPQVPSGTVAGGVSGGVVSGVPGGIVGGVAGGVRTGISGGIVGGVAGAVVAGSQAGRSACDWRGDAFVGMTDTSRRGDRDFIHERVGSSGVDFVIQKTFDDLRLCAFAQGLRDENRPSPTAWRTSGATRVILETQEPNLTRRMEIAAGVTTFSVNGQQRPVDNEAREWADRLTGLLDVVWELRHLRGQESSLRGQISSILGERSSLQGQISSLRGQVSSMRGEISSWLGRESSLRGEISSIQGQLSSMRGRISSEQGAISSLESRRWNAGDAERARIENQVAAHRARIAQIEQQIEEYDAAAKVRDVEQRLAQLDVDRQVTEIENRIREFNVDTRVADVEGQIVQLDVEKRIGEQERMIAALDVERRARDLERRIDEALKRLREARAVGAGR